MAKEYIAMNRDTRIVGQDGELFAVIQWEHWKVHQGKMFTVGFRDAELADEGYLSILITTGANGFHFAASLLPGGASVVHLYEAPPDVSGGTDLTAYNMARYSTNTLLTTFKHTPTVTNEGSDDLTGNGRFVPGGDKNQTRVGGEARQGTEFVLKSNTEYLLRLQNVSGAEEQCSAVIVGYEE